MLAEKFPELRGLTWEEFAAFMLDVDPDMDFITCHEMYEEVNRE